MSSKHSDPKPKPLPAVKPGALDRAGTAWYVSLSESSIERGVRNETFPAPRELSPGRVGWLVQELDAWLAARPVSDKLPPANTGASKPRSTSPGSPAPQA